MAETLNPEGLVSAAPPSGRQKSERLFMQALISAIIIRVASNFGLLGIAEMVHPFFATIVEYLPWALLALAAFAAFGMFTASPNGLKTSGNRLSSHYITWLVFAVFFLFMGLFSRQLGFIKTYMGKFGKAIQNFSDAQGLFIAATMALIAIAIAIAGSTRADAGKPGTVERGFVQHITAKIAAVPMAFTSVGIFVGATLWTVFYSFTGSKLLPKSNFVGLDQYERLWSANNSRWWISIENLMVYGLFSMVFSLTIGFLLATLLDQKIRFENTFRTILLYPFALSFIVTGLVWQWLLNPEYGVQRIVRSLGFENFTFDPLFNPDIVIFGVLIAGLWQGTGFIMCLMLAGMRGVDEEIWKASKVDGIPSWKTYIYVVIPIMRPVFITTLVIIASGIVRVYDLVVAQTSGGPGIASEVPAKYVYEYMFTAQNLGQGFAASTMMLSAVVVIVIPWAILEFGGRKQHG